MNLRFPLVVLVLPALLALAACGEGGDDDDGRDADDDNDAGDDQADDDSADDSGDDDFQGDFLGLAVGTTVAEQGVVYAFDGEFFQELDLPESLHRVSLKSCVIPAPNKAWVVGEDQVNRVGKLLYYDDGDWRDITPPGLDTYWSLRGVQAPSVNQAWAVGYDEVDRNGVILFYNYGVWNYVWPQPIGGDWSLNGVYFPVENQGVFVGQQDFSGELYGGVVVTHYWGTWDALDSPVYLAASRWLLYGARYADVDHGWLYGADDTNGRGVLVRYWEGMWGAADVPVIQTAWNVRDVDCLDRDHCLAVGQAASGRGVVLRYQDWAWTEDNLMYLVDPEHTWDLRALAYRGPDEAFAVGADGAGKGYALHYDGDLWNQMGVPAGLSAYSFNDLCVEP
jgi:hypothetical protein